MSATLEYVVPPVGGEKCCNPKRHSPQPRLLVRHHVVPESWGGKTTANNLVTLCPTCHMNVHVRIDQWVATGGKPISKRGFDVYTLQLAEQAWAQRPANPTRTL